MSLQVLFKGNYGDANKAKRSGSFSYTVLANDGKQVRPAEKTNIEEPEMENHDFQNLLYQILISRISKYYPLIEIVFEFLNDRNFFRPLGPSYMCTYHQIRLAMAGYVSR